MEIDGMQATPVKWPWPNMSFDEVEEIRAFALGKKDSAYIILLDMLDLRHKDCSLWPEELNKLRYIVHDGIFNETDRTYKSWEDEINRLFDILDEKYHLREKIEQEEAERIQRRKDDGIIDENGNITPEARKKLDEYALCMKEKLGWNKKKK